MMDRDSVLNTVAALAMAVDGHDWAVLDRLFTPEVAIDYTSLFGGEPATQPRAQLIAGWQGLLPGFSHTHHMIGQAQVRQDGDVAHVRAPVIAWHVCSDLPEAERTWQVAGRYEIGLERQDGQWLIASLTLAAAWSSGNDGLPAIAAERARSA
jgi:ketosteroid isomerase-like protein